MSKSIRYIFSVFLLNQFIASPLLFAQEVEEILVTAVRDSSIVRTEDTLVAVPDTAQLLKNMPGANINKNGELTGIAQYRGMFGNRLNVSINGGHISSGGPNAMDAPLHYAPVALLKSLSIHRGIVPVSHGQETIGGSVDAVTINGDFATGSDFTLSSRLYAGVQSVNEGNVLSGFFTMANRNHLFRASLMQESGDDSEFPSGRITPSEYQRQRVDLGYSFRVAEHEFSFDVVRNETGDAGTAALPMDIQSVDSDLLRFTYQWQSNDFRLKAQGSVNDIEHWMTNYHLRRPPQGNDIMPGPMLYRQVFAESESAGFKLELEQLINNGLWRYGIDGHYAGHNAEITNPNAGPFFIANFNNANRDVLGIFIEREMNLNSLTGLEFGLRVNKVSSNAGQVSANLNPMNATTGMPVMMNNMANMLAGQFNTQDSAKSDLNVDWFGRFSVESSSDYIWYVGLARKSRSASYQERYLWLPMESTGGLADGKTYVGNVDLKPEVAHEFEVGFDWEGDRLRIYPRLFYKAVKDYIQGTPSTSIQVNNFAQMMANMGMGAVDPLQFNNVNATLYGFDIESNLELNRNLSMRLVVSNVRGNREDIDDNLYRITPNNLLLALDIAKANWLASIETVVYQRQDYVSSTNLEQETAGYALVNASFRIDLGPGLEVGLGINNVFDRQHKEHLAGYNRAFNPDLALRERLPGVGRNIYGRLIWEF